uniref:Uncharacterized protein n=1 Tax=Anguilla anguilla TaxID=7936 RepID=A0A0E9SD54_ANGAN
MPRVFLIFEFICLYAVIHSFRTEQRREINVWPKTYYIRSVKNYR